MAEALFRERQQRAPILARPQIARENFRARFAAQRFGGVFSSTIGRKYLMRLRKFNSDGAANPPARAGDESDRLHYLILLVAQCFNRLDARGPSRREPDREKRDQTQRYRDHGEYKRIVAFHAEQEAFEKPRQREG